jgi:hypothetical protein
MGASEGDGLTEIMTEKGGDQTLRRRWFNHFELDLFVWHDRNDHRVVAFHLYHSKRTSEKAIQWREQVGYRFAKVESRIGPTSRASSLLFDDLDHEGRAGLFEAAASFARLSRSMDQQVAAVVSQHLEQLRAQAVAPSQLP